MQKFNDILEGQELDLTVDSFNSELRKVTMRTKESASKKDIDAVISNPEVAAAPVPVAEKPADEAPAAE